MQVASYSKQCPVCKAGLDLDKVIPIYGRGSENPDPRQEATKLQQPMPPRPAGQRTPAVPVGAQFRPAASCVCYHVRHVPKSDMHPAARMRCWCQPLLPRCPQIQQPPLPGMQPMPPPVQQGVLPALFGFQLGPGQGYVEALTPEQQHQVRCSPCIPLALQSHFLAARLPCSGN